MAIRKLFCLLLAIVITFGLFWTMQALVGVQGEMEEGGISPKIEFVRLRKNNAPQEKKREPPKRQKPEQAPPPPDISVSKASLEPSSDFAGISAGIDAAAALEGALGAGAGSDRDAVPLVRIEPDYPMRARQRGVEGWAHIGFTISRSGTVKDAHIINSQPKGVFDKDSLNAVNRWKYNPKIVNGAPVERPGQQVWFPFEMEN
ncbi:MAG: protein TonB [Myxococcota bacterium]|jgi:protein TonB